MQTALKWVDNERLNNKATRLNIANCFKVIVSRANERVICCS